jgi:hypothetical protein
LEIDAEPDTEAVKVRIAVETALPWRFFVARMKRIAEAKAQWNRYRSCYEYRLLSFGSDLPGF